MPESLTAPRKGSFADVAGEPEIQQDNGEAERQAAEKAAQAKAAEDKAAADKAAKEAADKEAAEKKPKDEPEDPKDDNLNPHLSEPVEKKKEDVVADEVPPGMTQKAQDTWKSLKQDNKSLAANVASLQSELAGAKKQIEQLNGSGTELETLKEELQKARKQIEEFEGEIAISRVESTKDFKKNVTEVLSESETTVRNLAKKYEMSPAALLDALHEPDATLRNDRLEELTTDMKNLDRIDLYEASKRYSAAHKMGEQMRTSAGERLSDLEKSQQAATEKERAEANADYQKAVSEAFKNAQAQHTAIRPFDGNDKWNAYVDSIKAKALALDVNKIPIADLAKSIVAEQVLGEVVKERDHWKSTHDKQKAKITELEQRLAEYRETTPGAGDGLTGHERQIESAPAGTRFASSL